MYQGISNAGDNVDKYVHIRSYL